MKSSIYQISIYIEDSKVWFYIFSGGSWVSSMYTYAQVDYADEELLGDILYPDTLSREVLQKMDPKCARSFASQSLTVFGLKAYKSGEVNSAGEAWSYGVWETYLKPVGVERKKLFSWNEATVADIIDRNPSLANETFYLPKNSARPYLVIGSSLVGPQSSAPYYAALQNYTMIEFTPLYVGQMQNLEVSYGYDGKIINKNSIEHVGGLVEPFAFGISGSSAPDSGLNADETTGILSVPQPEVAVDLSAAAGASSYAVGAFLESLPFSLSEKLGMTTDYWSPSNAKPKEIPMLLADGGSYENIPLINYIQRRIPKIVLFFMSSVPLQPASKWNVTTDDYADDQITDDLSAFFGALPAKWARWENRSYEYYKDQVFSTNDYATVVQALQDAQSAGKGILATFNLTTIENPWWGIPAGLTFEITFSYLGRLPQWENQLSPDMYELLVPDVGDDDLSIDIDHGPYKYFPHYNTEGGNINYEKANVLADLTGWSVLENAEFFRKVLS